MSYGNNEAIEEQERNKKWKTKKCSSCGENYPVMAEDYNTSVYCQDCETTLYSKDD